MQNEVLDYILRFAYEFVVGFAATACFAWLMRAPCKTPFTCGIIGSIGYLVFRAFSLFLGNDIIGSFIATSVIAISGEFCARRFKMPATVFIFPSLIPLVPGFALYRTMYALVQSDYSGFVRNGAETLFIAGSIAIAVAFVNIIARHVLKSSAVKKCGKNGK